MRDTIKTLLVVFVLIAIAAQEEGGIEGFLKKHGICGNDDSFNSYALACDPKLPEGEIYVE